MYRAAIPKMLILVVIYLFLAGGNIHSQSGSDVFENGESGLSSDDFDKTKDNKDNPAESNSIENSPAQENWTGTWRRYAETIKKSSGVVRIYQDNEKMQSYRGRIGLWIKGTSGTPLSSLAKRYGVSIEEISIINDLPRNAEKIYSASWVFAPYSIEYQRDLEKAGWGRMAWEIPQGQMIWPVSGGRITSRHGPRWDGFHAGVDIATPTGELVMAASAGIVIHARYSGAYGNCVEVLHEGGYITRYAHLSETLVKSGDMVEKGQTLAFSGNTGKTTGPHLHFEVRYDQVVLNPEFFLPEFDQARRNDTAISRNGVPVPVNN